MIRGRHSLESRFEIPFGELRSSHEAEQTSRRVESSMRSARHLGHPVRRDKSGGYRACNFRDRIDSERGRAGRQRRTGGRADERVEVCQGRLEAEESNSSGGRALHLVRARVCRLRSLREQVRCAASIPKLVDDCDSFMCFSARRDAERSPMRETRYLEVPRRE